MSRFETILDEDILMDMLYVAKAMKVSNSKECRFRYDKNGVSEKHFEFLSKDIVRLRELLTILEEQYENRTN